jgi:hypothetical protein
MAIALRAAGKADPSKVQICGAMNKTALWPAVKASITHRLLGLQVQTSRRASLELSQRKECIQAVTEVFPEVGETLISRLDHACDGDAAKIGALVGLVA